MLGRTTFHGTHSYIGRKVCPQTWQGDLALPWVSFTLQTILIQPLVLRILHLLSLRENRSFSQWLVSRPWLFVYLCRYQKDLVFWMSWFIFGFGGRVFGSPFLIEILAIVFWRGLWHICFRVFCVPLSKMWMILYSKRLPIYFAISLFCKANIGWLVG